MEKIDIAYMGEIEIWDGKDWDSKVDAGYNIYYETVWSGGNGRVITAEVEDKDENLAYVGFCVVMGDYEEMRCVMYRVGESE